MRCRAVAAGLLAFSVSVTCLAQEGASTPTPQPTGTAPATPFIDQMKREMPPGGGEQPSPSSPQPFIDSLKKKMAPEPDDGSFIDKVKNENPGYFKQNPDGSYTDKVKSNIGPSQPGGAIQAVNEGHSELHARRLGAPTAAFGIQMTYLINPNFTASNGAEPFSSVYPGFTPDVSFTYNRRLLSFWSGEIAFTAALGGTYNHGQGLYQFRLQNWNVSGFPQFPAQSLTGFQFISVPMAAGFDYRMTGTKYIQPYVSIQPTLIPYVETRNDNGPTYYGDSRCITSSLGVWLQLDWLSDKASWGLYDDYRIYHYYLTLLYQNVVTLDGGVDFSYSGATVGLAFEF